MQPLTVYTRYRTVARAAAAVVGGAALTGGVKRDAALCLIACAGALWVLSGRPSAGAAIAARTAGGAVAVYALATLSGLVPDLAPTAVAAGFVLVGGALAGLDVTVGGRWSPAPLAAGSVAVLALVTLAASGGGGWPSALTEVPEDTVPLMLDLLFLSVGALLARPDRQPVRGNARDTQGGAVLRRLLPLAIGAPLLLSGAGPEPSDWLPSALVLALALVLVWIFAREIDRADERLDALRVQDLVGDADAAQLPKSVV
jgi:hypothetical protein